MQNIERAVERLTKDHTEILDGTVGTSGPLLEELRLARYPSLGKSVGGAGEGMMLNVQALGLYEHIDGAVRAWLAHYRHISTGDLVELTAQLHQVLRTEHAGGRLEDPDRMFAMFSTWVHQIEDNFDPPHEYELTASCPECGEGHVKDEDGKQKRAVRVPVKAGRAVIAECHACGRMWATRDELTELAEAMQVEVDWVKLRELTGDTQVGLTRL